MFSTGFLIIYKRFNFTGIKKILIRVNPIYVLITVLIYILIKISAFDLFVDIKNIISEFKRPEKSTELVESIIDYAFYTFAFLCYPLESKEKKYINVIPMIALIIIETIAASRAVIVVSIFYMMSVNLIQNKSSDRIKNFIKLALILIIVFTTVGYLRGSFDQGLFRVLSVYLFGGLMAFDTILINEAVVNSNINMFPTIAKIFNGAGINITPNEYNYPLVGKEIPTNIYTSFREVYNDFGSGILMFIFALMHGVITGIISKYNFKNNIFTSDIALLSLISTFNLYFVFYPIFLFSFIYLVILISLFFRFRSVSAIENERV